MSVEWEEHLKVVRQVGHLLGAIEAHRILTKSDEDRGYDPRVQDGILYGLASEVNDA